VAIVVNPATGTVYTANLGGENVTVIAPNTPEAIPLTASVQGVTDSSTISGQAIFATGNASPSFTATATSSFTPTAPPPTALYYQLDTAQGVWQKAVLTSSAGANPASYSFSLSSLPYGVHTVYAYAVFGQEGAPEARSPSEIDFDSHQGKGQDCAEARACSYGQDEEGL
jgi:hypothetical protein